EYQRVILFLQSQSKDNNKNLRPIEFTDTQKLVKSGAFHILERSTDEEGNKLDFPCKNPKFRKGRSFDNTVQRGEKGETFGMGRSDFVKGCGGGGRDGSEFVNDGIFLEVCETGAHLEGQYLLGQSHFINAAQLIVQLVYYEALGASFGGARNLGNAECGFPGVEGGGNYASLETPSLEGGIGGWDEGRVLPLSGEKGYGVRVESSRGSPQGQSGEKLGDK
ncbi:hypothetical protein CRG98_016772, partial [Punica granatum]